MLELVKPLTERSPVMSFVRSTAALAVCLFVSLAVKAVADDPPYTEGPVVSMTFVKVKSGGD